METAQPAHQENHRIGAHTTFRAAYEEALRRGRNDLLAADIAACCTKGGAILTRNREGAAAIELCFLNRTVRIALPQLCFSTGPAGEDIPIWEKILILHYLANSPRSALQETLINYRRLRDGALYSEAFERRCIQPLLKAFGSRPDTLFAAAARLGGVPADFGDCAVRIPVFPRIDIICCLWKGDDEFAPEATMLFDAGIEGFLCAEDIAVLCQQIILKIIRR